MQGASPFNKVVETADFRIILECFDDNWIIRRQL